MLRINKVRHQVLLKRLEEYRIARHKLVPQLEELDTQARVEELDTQARVIQQECNSVAPIGCLPEEVLAMVFEAGTHFDRGIGIPFVVLVSHITNSWRNIALATPRLWETIRCYKAHGMQAEPYPEAGKERTAAFLARSRSSPIDLYIDNIFSEDQFLQLIGDHFGRCQHLSIMDIYGDVLPDALTLFSSQPAPPLESFQLILEPLGQGYFKFKYPLFPFGVPHLKTADIDGITLSTVHFCLAALQSVTSLRLSNYSVDPNDGYAQLRDSLVTFPSLIHLELQASDWAEEDASNRPIVLPTLQSLLGHNLHPSVLSMIHAASLTVLILELPRTVHPCELHFPSLQHLVLFGVDWRMRGDFVLTRFPGIERLTFKNRPHDQTLGVRNILAALGPGTSAREDRNNGHYTPYPRLRTLALSPSYYRPRDVAKLAAKISSLQGEGVPIGKLMLPEIWLTQAGADLEALAELRECVEIADFRIDWPTPFSSERFACPE